MAKEKWQIVRNERKNQMGKDKALKRSAKQMDGFLILSFMKQHLKLMWLEECTTLFRGDHE